MELADKVSCQSSFQICIKRAFDVMLQTGSAEPISFHCVNLLGAVYEINNIEVWPGIVG